MLTDNHQIRPPRPNPASVAAFLAEVRLGRANAVNAATLAEKLALGRGENGKRRVRKLAEAAVEAGNLVCGDDSGYFRPATPDEATANLRRFDAQIARMAARRRHLAALVGDAFFGGQIPML